MTCVAGSRCNAGQAGPRAIAYAQPLAQNAHKVPMTSAAIA